MRSYDFGMRVLVVDDAALVRVRLVERLTEASGVTVVGAAADGNEAVALARSLGPDVVVLDLNLPGLSGLEVLAVLKAQPNPPMVIVMTNHAHDHYRKECLSAGADFFFDKSTEFDRVADAVTGAIERS